MKIAIRKETNGIIYIDKNLREEIDYTQPPYNFKIVEVEDCYFDCIGTDFNEDLSFSVEKYNARNQNENSVKRIAELKSLLAKTDYISNKLAEANARYIITEDKTELINLQTKYSKELADRQAWRDEINSLGG